MAEDSAPVPGTANGFTTKMPSTKLGKWSMWLGAAFVVGFIINNALVGIFGTSTSEAMRSFSRTYLPYWGIALMSVGLVSGLVGLVAIVKQKERSLLTLLTLIPTAFVIVFVAGEFLLPH
jgi:hypothetical protein